MSLRSALMGLTNAGKNGKNVFISAKILSKILGVLLASALMNLRSALMSLRSAPMSALMSFRSALMSLISAGKNGENVFISAKILSSVLLASALINLRSALLSLRSASMSLLSAGKNGKNVFISVKSSVVIGKRAYEIISGLIG